MLPFWILFITDFCLFQFICANNTNVAMSLSKISMLGEYSWRNDCIICSLLKKAKKLECGNVFVWHFKGFLLKICFAYSHYYASLDSIWLNRNVNCFRHFRVCLGNFTLFKAVSRSSSINLLFKNMCKRRRRLDFCHFKKEEDETNPYFSKISLDYLFPILI